MFFSKIKKKKLVVLGLSVIFLLALAVGLLVLFPQKKTRSECLTVASEATASAKTLPIISKEKLKIFDGIKNPKVYVGLDCLVYNVTDGKDQYYGEGKSYHYLVGRDSTSQLKIFGGDIIKEKYPIVGILGN